MTFTTACMDSETMPVSIRSTEVVEQNPRRGPQDWDTDFPAQADLAILLDTQDQPIVDVRTTDENGSALLPEAWLTAVQNAYANTDVMDAVQRENRYEEWRLVSARVSPCAPIGIQPDVDIDTWCWPTVRLVWQPVVEDFRLAWGVNTDFYADDRAIHAIYSVAPRGLDGERIEGEWREVVAEHLSEGNDPSDIPPRMRDGFKAVRDASAIAVLNGVHDLRDPSLLTTAYRELDLRPETMNGDGRRYRFAQQLRTFLSEFASWQDLGEMTSFSLPEGRNPAGSDIWVFVGFDGNNGFPQLKELNVVGRYSGTELVNIGPSQTVAVGIEDDAVQNALDRGNRELRESVIIGSEDIAEIGPDMADPYEFLVPNTSCASCHRLNGLRFDFHSLSGFEDRGITVSPRVNKDVARDMIWTRSNLLR